MTTEVEIKLYCFPEDINWVTANPLIASGVELETSHLLENTYYDTPDLALRAERLAVRVRKTPTAELQTVKSAAKSTVAGMSSRPEWETPFAGSFDFRPIESHQVRHFLEIQKSHLVPIFKTVFQRRTWRIEVSKNIAILVMVDEGQIHSGEQNWPISEVELELERGNPEDLLDFAIALTSKLPLVPFNLSKAERGYHLFQQHPLIPQKASASPLHSHHNPAEGFQLLATQGMQMWQSNLFGTLTNADQEFIHQYRVSLRRLNSLIKVFKPALPGRYRKKWTKRVKDLSRATGEVRDLEVMRSVILEPMLESADQETVTHAKLAIAAATCASQEAFNEIQQLRFAGSVLLFFRDLQELDTKSFPKNLRRFAESQIGGLHKNAVKRLAKTLKTPTPERAHHFRIALKHLRYSCEFFAPIFDEDEMHEYAKAIASLQDVLGFINDFYVALSRLQDWTDQGVVPKATCEAVRAWHAGHAHTVLNNALTLSESVMNLCQPWCTECERRGITAVRRRLKHELKSH